MTLEARRAGDAIARSAGDLARVWRAARLQARPDVFPGLLDAVVQDFFARAGELLAAGRDPALVWPSTVGLARLDPRARDRGREEIDAALKAYWLERAQSAPTAEDLKQHLAEESARLAAITE